MTSTIKVNNVQNQCGANIINESSNTITIGASGDTIALASGASQTGFGREGSVNWQTGSIKTSTFTATSGEGYFCNTSGGAFTVNLPAGSAGAIVAVSDYTRTFQTNNLTVTPNGSEKIGGTAASATLSTEGQSATFVYVDATEGWINVQETSNSVTGRTFITATGGTITTSGDFKIHTFTGPGTFCVSQASSVSAENTLGYLVVAGGGGGQSTRGGGGGAGGFREGRNVPIDNFTASPLVANAPTNAVTITATSYPITVGAGGVGGSQTPPVVNTSGSNSIFSTITSTGGGRGGGPEGGGSLQGGAGGSGGGSYNPGTAVGPGNNPPTTPAQGNDGGSGAGAPNYGAGGGGGAGAVGNNGTTSAGANGGAGVSTSITGSSVARAGGGGGATYNTSSVGSGGSGGGGAASPGAGSPYVGVAGTVNTGGGGGGNSNLAPGAPGPGGAGGAGGSGIVVIRYKYQ